MSKFKNDKELAGHLLLVTENLNSPEQAGHMKVNNE